MSRLWQMLVVVVLVFAGQIVMAADSVHDFKLKSIDGDEVSLADYQGKVLLIVNVASECGLTPQYKELQALYEKYEKDGLVVVGIPCNQFGGQEPGTEKEIKKFCTERYKVTFPMMSKVDVNGDNQDPLYAYLKENSDSKEKIGWNFEKFIVGKDGKVIARFSPRTKPDDEAVISVIENSLKAEVK